ncbi:MAG TPA: hypothetical protein DF383_13465, partial [Deltaproteobacteria bacterium]|nr:hypothetical protein [Deltaproteobacteria bacterium]
MSLRIKSQIQRYFRRFFFLLGLGLFAYLVYRLKPSTILAYLQTIGWNFASILAVSLLWMLAYSFAWEIFLKTLSKRVRFGEIFKIKVAGEAVNSITPLSWGGGDPARVLWLKSHIPLTEGTASVVVDRTLNNLAIALFMILGVLLAFIRFQLPPALKLGFLLALAVILGVSCFLYLRSHEGLFGFFLDLLQRLKLKKNFSEKTRQSVQEIDGHISRFYKKNRKGFAA